MIVLPSERSQYHNIFIDKDLSQPNTAFYSYKQLIKIIKQLYSIAVSFLVLKYFKSSYIYIFPHETTATCQLRLVTPSTHYHVIYVNDQYNK